MDTQGDMQVDTAFDWPSEGKMEEQECEVYVHLMKKDTIRTLLSNSGRMLSDPGRELDLECAVENAPSSEATSEPQFISYVDTCIQSPGSEEKQRKWPRQAEQYVAPVQCASQMFRSASLAGHKGRPKGNICLAKQRVVWIGVDPRNNELIDPEHCQVKFKVVLPKLVRRLQLCFLL